jgi:hypothetical protein
MDRPENYVIKIYGLDGGDRSSYTQTADIKAEVKAAMRTYNIRPKSYAEKRYPGCWPLFHEWDCTRKITVIAHQIG